MLRGLVVLPATRVGRVWAVAVGVLLAATIIGCGNGSILDDAGADSAIDVRDAASVDASDARLGCDVTPGDFTMMVDVDGAARIYQLHVPEGMPTNARAPVIVGLHGGGGRGESVQLGLDVFTLADREKVLVVLAEGTEIPDLPYVARSWNAGGCCPSATVDEVDDTAYVSAVLDDLMARRCVDEDRVFATGLSNGAMMAHRLACELSDRIAAVAPVAAALSDRDLESCLVDCAPPSTTQSRCLDACLGPLPTFFECAPSRPVPIMHVHGRLDANAPYEGGVGANAQAVPAPVHPRIDDAVDRLRIRNECGAATVETYRNAGTNCIRYLGCRDDAHVELCSVADGGHTWPGGNLDSPVCYRTDPASRRLCGRYAALVGPISTQLDVLERMWAFFVEHPRP